MYVSFASTPGTPRKWQVLPDAEWADQEGRQDASPLKETGIFFFFPFPFPLLSPSSLSFWWAAKVEKLLETDLTSPCLDCSLAVWCGESRPTALSLFLHPLKRSDSPSLCGLLGGPDAMV